REGLEDRGELAADDPAAEDDEPARNLRLREQPGRVDTTRGVEAADRWPEREGARGDDRGSEAHVLGALDADRVRVAESSGALYPLDAVRLEQQRDAVGHLLHDACLPLVRGAEVELRLADTHAELRERLPRLLQRERRLDPRLRRDAADPKAGAAQLRLLLDARDA